MKQFSLEEYLKNPSKKIVTRDGRNVTIQHALRLCGLDELADNFKL